MSARNEIVYFKPSCTDCEKVIQYANYYNIDLHWRNIDEGDNAKKLVEDTGQDTIPAMVIPGQVILGQQPIIDYIMENYALEADDLDAMKA